MKSRTKHRIETTDNAAWIEPHRRAYLEQLVTQGYALHTRRVYRRTINRFCEELERCAPKRQELDAVVIEAIRNTVLSGIHERTRTWTGFQLGRFVEYLAKAGLAYPPEASAKEPTPLDCLHAEYASYLHFQRKLRETTIYHCLSFFKRFMAFRFMGALGDLNAIEPEDIVSFLCTLTAKGRPYRDKTAPSHLRSLFKFLFWSGKTERNLANSIPRVAHPQVWSLPRFLKPDEIQRLIDAAWSDDAMGRRNHAMMLLLARLGLRAPEVVAIQLEDLDWRSGEILVRGKGKLYDRMPLPNEVGEAIVNYIQNGRVGACRALFVSNRAPHQAFKDARIINDVLNKAFAKTGLKQPQRYVGSHLLRHSLATAMLGRGASLEEISHVLRHRSRATTTIYAKCDLGALRSIARAWPLEGGVR